MKGGPVSTHTAGERPLGSLLNEPIRALSGIGPKREKLLANLGIAAVRDLLFHFPRDYQDRRRTTPIAEVREGVTVTIEAEVVNAQLVRLRGRLSLTKVALRDATGAINATWFGRGFLAKAFTPGARGLFTGPVGKHQGLALKNPDYEILSGDEDDLLHTGRIVPLYRLTEQVTQRMLRRWVSAALEEVDAAFEETLPGALRERHGFPGIRQAMREAHFPESFETAHTARNRFAYEELLAIQVAVLGRRMARGWEEKSHRHRIDGPILSALRASLPFALTRAQVRAVEDILQDMASPSPMLRLLQGDVGCGKTIVALHAIAAAADGGYQTALMAPTEILAEQHFRSALVQLVPLGLHVDLLTRSTRSLAAVRRSLASGTTQVIVGTHALIQETVKFHRLGLAIVDEQHRFGVVQRGALAAKGLTPDILQMTATPIPRTLAITVFGGMDITVIDELPPGRQPVKTRRITPAKVADLYIYISNQAAKGFQAYLICPLVEESDTKELTAVTRHYEELSAGPFAHLRTALLHGRLDGAEKEAILRRFIRGEIDVLFSTSVIEVGIDAPNATTMVIEDAAQFGLTQLHQLRGRVGRGSEPSHCFLLGAPKTPEGKRRMEVLCATSNGFEIAEEDLTLRGPGEFHGVRQAGLSDLRVADLIRDARLLDHARRDAQEILNADPQLANPEHRRLAAAARQFEEARLGA